MVKEEREPSDWLTEEYARKLGVNRADVTTVTIECARHGISTFTYRTMRDAVNRYPKAINEHLGQKNRLVHDRSSLNAFFELVEEKAPKLLPTSYVRVAELRKREVPANAEPEDTVPIPATVVPNVQEPTVVSTPTDLTAELADGIPDDLEELLGDIRNQLARVDLLAGKGTGYNVEKDIERVDAEITRLEAEGKEAEAQLEMELAKTRAHYQAQIETERDRLEELYTFVNIDPAKLAEMRVGLVAEMADVKAIQVGRAAEARLRARKAKLHIAA